MTRATDRESADEHSRKSWFVRQSLQIREAGGTVEGVVKRSTTSMSY